MIADCRGFNEVKDGFISRDYPCVDWNTNNKKLLVKAHERYVFEYNDDLVMTKIHRDNGGIYNFSKQDFLSHKLQEIVFPHISPKLFAADFSDNECPAFLIERITLDEGHKAYNVLHQQMHIQKGDSYEYNRSFFDISGNIYDLFEKHKMFCEKTKAEYADSLVKYGIAFDIAAVNLALVNGMPAAVEMHKCRRPYLFDYKRCCEYFINEHKNACEVEEALCILTRIKELSEKEA
ncbi:MAG: hypothetical protein PHW77_07985 [Eubacteriales bacterium]|nr:hypothetical protein [Eubacteriales bacterium]